jgi:hypothetical protein
MPTGCLAAKQYPAGGVDCEQRFGSAPGHDPADAGGVTFETPIRS